MNTTIDHHLNLNFYQNNNVFFAHPQVITHDYDYYSNTMNKIRSDDEVQNNKITFV